MERRNVLTLGGYFFWKQPVIDTSLRLIIYDAQQYLREILLKLLHLYGDIEVTVDGKRMRITDIKSADVIEVDGSYDYDKPRYTVADAVRIIDRLMQKDGGCPWDSVQTHDSIRVNMIEEAYEAVDAIDKRDKAAMIEEFGDVFLQSLLQSAIAKRDKEFDFTDVCDALCKKLISRHTFIFGDDSAAGESDALTLWDKNKAKEKHYVSVKDQLERLPQEFPSLLRCQKAYKKIKKAGIPTDMFELDDAIEKGDYAKAIASLTAKLADEGKDAEVELNRIVGDIVKDLPSDK